MSCFSSNIWWKGYLSFIKLVLYLGQNSEWRMFLWIYFWVIFPMSVIDLSISSAASHCQDDCSYRLNLLSAKVILPTSSFFFVRIALCTQDPVFFQLSLRVSLSVFTKKKHIPCLGFDRHCLKPIAEFGENWHLCCIEYSSPWI